MKTFLSLNDLPFCKGCGHNIVAINTEKALQRIENLEVLDVIVVSDIGCIGIIDKQYNSHTIHGLHGRSPALAAGISMALDNPKKKILVYIGDGGATIGLSHILEAANKNLNMTVLIHNNMLYGMTGGQPSGLTPIGFKTAATPEGKKIPPLDICKLAHAAGAARVQRIIAIGDFSNDIAEALKTPGFSLIEFIELCPSYGVKYNPDKKPAELAKESGIEPVLYTNVNRPVYKLEIKSDTKTLLDDEITITVSKDDQKKYNNFSLLLAGSAGEGVQTSGEILAETAISCGLSATKKGSYPVTVGVGFSLSEIIVKNKPILYTGIENPDYIVITSIEGLQKVQPILNELQGKTTIFIDKSLDFELKNKNNVEIIRLDLRTPLGARNCTIYSLAVVLKIKNLLPLEMFYNRVNTRFGKKFDLETLKTKISNLDLTT